MNINAMGVAGAYNAPSVNRTQFPEQRVDAAQGVPAFSPAQSARDTMRYRPDLVEGNQNTYQPGNDGDDPDFAAINLMNNSFPEQQAARTTEYDLNTLYRAETETGARTETQRQTTQIEDRLNESATLQTSDQIAERSTNDNVSPAQQRGAEAYERTQTYNTTPNTSFAPYYA